MLGNAVAKFKFETDCILHYSMQRVYLPRGMGGVLNFAKKKKKSLWACFSEYIIRKEHNPNVQVLLYI